ncbi:mammalian cell entry protein [Mycolicibacterium komossense]|uniref:Mammalian cell entry protein n=1 Tax=Mycolicibacterium komossense TaxID=1779 RepID=A0ABT3CMP5_9MYCO|nr:mammalian cell entry protein [Mycolicibacterium komossense]MCV7230781.1 mammalian cell entry protein [Mycolicibacterium komossense]
MAESPPAATAAQSDETAKQRRRRASRAAGPATATTDATATAVTARVELPADTTPRSLKPAAPPPRRQPNRRLFGWLAAASGFVVAAVLAASVFVLVAQQRNGDAVLARDQRFVDTASQTVLNMFSYTQDNIDQSVNQFVDGTSGPLRDTLSQGNNVDNLKAMFRDTHASSEAVINGAALEGLDDTRDNASVLVAVRVTVTDLDGVNKPSQAYRLRVVVHEDDNGRMTGYDLKYPDGGN